MLLFGYATTRKDFVIFTCSYFKLSNWRNFSCSSIMYVPNSAWCREGSGIGGRVRKKHQSYQLLWNWKKGWTFAYSLHLVAYDGTCFSPLIMISTPFSNQWLWAKRTAKPTRRTLWTFFFCIAFLWMLQMFESDSHLNTIVKKTILRYGSDVRVMLTLGSMTRTAPHCVSEIWQARQLGLIYITVKIMCCTIIMTLEVYKVDVAL